MTEQLVIRNLPEDTKAALRRKGAPAETVARELLIASVTPTEDPVLGWLAAAAELPPGPELVPPPRGTSRDLGDLFE